MGDGAWPMPLIHQVKYSFKRYRFICNRSMLNNNERCIHIIGCSRRVNDLTFPLLP